MKNEHDFDRQLKAALKEELGHTKPLLRADQAWDYIQTKRQIEKLRKRKRTTRICITAAILFFMLSMTFPNQGRAFFNITTIFHKVQDSFVQLFAGNEVELSEGDPTVEMFDPDITEVDENRMQKSPTVEAMHELKGFQKVKPTYIPESFELVDTKVYKENDAGSTEVYLHYELGEKHFVITQIKQNESIGFNGFVQSKEEKVEEVDVNGSMGNLIKASKDDYILVWFSSSYYLSIEGNIQPNELKKIARSISVN